MNRARLTSSIANPTQVPRSLFFHRIDAACCDLIQPSVFMVRQLPIASGSNRANPPKLSRKAISVPTKTMIPPIRKA